MRVGRPVACVVVVVAVAAKRSHEDLPVSTSGSELSRRRSEGAATLRRQTVGLISRTEAAKWINLVARSLSCVALLRPFVRRLSRPRAQITHCVAQVSSARRLIFRQKDRSLCARWSQSLRCIRPGACASSGGSARMRRGRGRSEPAAQRAATALASATLAHANADAIGRSGADCKRYSIANVTVRSLSSLLEKLLEIQ